MDDDAVDPGRRRWDAGGMHECTAAEDNPNGHLAGMHRDGDGNTWFRLVHNWIGLVGQSTDARATNGYPYTTANDIRSQSLCQGLDADTGGRVLSISREQNK